MKTSHLLLSLLLLLSIVSCKKKTELQAAVNPAPCVMYKYGFAADPAGEGTIICTFNSQHFPIRAELTGSTYRDGSYYTYHYLNDSLIDTITCHYVSTPPGDPTYTETYIYSYLPSGNVASLKTIHIENNTTYSSTCNYSYSNSTLTITAASIQSYYNTYHFDANGDIDRMQYYDSTGQLYREALYTYDNHPNGFGALARYEILPAVFDHNASAHNLTRSVSIHFNGATSDTSIVTYSYDYNSNGYPLVQNVFSYDTVAHNLEYSCN